MLDLGRIVALLMALHAGARARWKPGLVAATLIGIIDVTVMLAPIRSRTAPPDAGHAFVVAFWGPSKMPMPPTSIPWLDAVLSRYPMIVPLVTASIAATATIRAFRIAAPLRPESARARAYDRIALRFLFVAVLDGILVIMDVMASHFLSNVL